MRRFDVSVSAIVSDTVEVEAETAEEAAELAETLFLAQLDAKNLSVDEVTADEPETEWQDGDPLTPDDANRRYGSDVGVRSYGPI